MSDSCDPTDCSLPGSSAYGIIQARILEWVSPSPGDLPDPGIEPESPALQADSLPSEPPGLITISMGIQCKGSLAILQSILLLGLQFCCVSYTHSPSHSRPAHLTAAMMGRESSQACVRTTQSRAGRLVL